MNIYSRVVPWSGRHNQLLAALPHANWERLAPNFRRVHMRLGKVLYESHEQPHTLYFPETSIVSLVYTTLDGASAEVSIVGNDGIVGLSRLLSDSGSGSQVIVQSAGSALSIAGHHLQREFDRHGGLHKLLLRYAQTLFERYAQVAVCNRHHTVTQQLCRWILVSVDHLPTNDLQMTQELIANMIGVRRTGVTEVANRLRNLGIIAYTRGRIKILDRARLEAACCECYQAVVAETERLVPRVHAAPDWYA